MVATVIGLAACAGAKSVSTATEASVRVGALRLTVPQGFNRLTRRFGRSVGVLVTDYSVKPGSPTLTKGIFPPDGVALVLGQATGPPVAAPSLRLPFALDQSRRQTRVGGTVWNGILRFEHSLYTVSFWAGRTAQPHDRAVLLHALESIHRAS